MLNTMIVLLVEFANIQCQNIKNNKYLLIKKQINGKFKFKIIYS